MWVCKLSVSLKESRPYRLPDFGHVAANDNPRLRIVRPVVSAVTATQPGHSPTNIATSITHLPFGPVSSFTYGNGVL
jgi:hypothetical protein